MDTDQERLVADIDSLLVEVREAKSIFALMADIDKEIAAYRAAYPDSCDQ